MHIFRCGKPKISVTINSTRREIKFSPNNFLRKRILFCCDCCFKKSNYENKRLLLPLPTTCLEVKRQAYSSAFLQEGDTDSLELFITYDNISV